MFNIFKKTQNQNLVVAATPIKYPAIVHEIHNEFLTAGDKILEEAKLILEEASKKRIDKGKKLAAAGFKKCPEAATAISVENEIIKTNELASLVNEYRIRYVNNKFITEHQVKQICEKYGLVCGDISIYKGFVPENNLNAIIAFKDNHPSICEEIYEYGRDFYTYKQWESRCGKGHADIVKKEDRVSNRMKICAPLKDMEITDKQEIVGYKIKNIPDPVVLQPIKGGYLIVTAWGDEASDEMVVNEIKN